MDNINHLLQVLLNLTSSDIQTIKQALAYPDVLIKLFTLYKCRCINNNLVESMNTKIPTLLFNKKDI